LPLADPIPPRPATHHPAHPTINSVHLLTARAKVVCSASAQADKAYCFEERKPIPDLAAEVVITGERETKLKRYAALQVAEVWFWIDNEIRVYRLSQSKVEASG
jgi:Uma2 family endonuclease